MWSQVARHRGCDLGKGENEDQIEEKLERGGAALLMHRFDPNPATKCCHDSPISAADPVGALGGIRTPNLLIRSQMLYPLSYERWLCP